MTKAKASLPPPPRKGPSPSKKVVTNGGARSKEYVSESDMGSEDNDSSIGSHASGSGSGKSTDSESGSVLEDEDEDEDEGENESESGSDEEQEVEDNGVDDATKPKGTQPSRPSESNHTSQQVSTLETQSAPRPQVAFTPPSGFQPLQASSTTPKTNELLCQNHLDGRQLWHITAPAAVPLSAVKEVLLEKFKNGEAVLTHNGAQYGFKVEEGVDRRGTALLLPNQRGDGYKAAHTPFSLSLTMHQIVHIPSRVAPPTRRGTKRPPRQQPQGLKMRFGPAGSGMHKASTIGSGSSSGEEAEREQPFRKPRGLESSSPPKKRKHVAASELSGTVQHPPSSRATDAKVEAQEKKQKKRRQKDGQGEEDVAKHQETPSTVPNGVDPTLSATMSGSSAHPTVASTDHQRGRPASAKSTEPPEYDEQGRRRETSAERAKRKRKEQQRRRQEEEKEEQKRRRAEEEEKEGQKRKKDDGGKDGSEAPGAVDGRQEQKKKRRHKEGTEGRDASGKADGSREEQKRKHQEQKHRPREKDVSKSKGEAP